MKGLKKDRTEKEEKIRQPYTKTTAVVQVLMTMLAALFLAPPCVAVANTEGLEGTPNEVKLKYLADNDFKDLSGEALKNAISQRIKEKKSNLVGDMSSQGTTPRRLTDLIGSLCDLTSGSGDKGTPVILVQGYFDNYTN